MAIFLISGVPGTGKSSVCRALLQHHEFGLHVPVDDLREMVVSGVAHPVPEWTAETARQFQLARQAAGKMASLYALVGFWVAIDDVLGPTETAVFDLPLPPLRILLWSELDVVLERNRTRQNKHFDTSMLQGVIGQLHAQQHLDDYRHHGWHVLDTTHQSLDQTVQAILELLPSAHP